MPPTRISEFPAPARIAVCVQEREKRTTQPRLVNLWGVLAVCMGMRNEFRPQTARPGQAQHPLHCTCSPIRWSSPVLSDVDTVELPCLAFAPNPVSEQRSAEPRRNHQVSTWDWSRAGSRYQRRSTAA